MHTPQKNLEVTRGLIATANATTGKEDTTLTGAVGSLVDGYGAGGGSDNFYDTFWDTYQQNGERTNYQYAFYLAAWNDKNFKPKYDIKPTGAGGYSIFKETRITNLTQLLEDCGVTLDTSECTSLQAAFSASSVTHLPVISLEKVTINSNLSMFCYICYNLVRIEKLISSKDTWWYGNMFNGCTKLEHCIVEGEIGRDFTCFAPCPLLDDESVQSIIDCLVDLTGKDTKTIKFHPDITAKIDANPAQLLAITDKNWTLA